MAPWATIILKLRGCNSIKGENSCLIYVRVIECRYVTNDKPIEIEKSHTSLSLLHLTDSVLGLR